MISRIRDVMIAFYDVENLFVLRTIQIKIRRDIYRPSRTRYQYFKAAGIEICSFWFDFGVFLGGITFPRRFN